MPLIETLNSKKYNPQHKGTSKLWFDSECRKLKGEILNIDKSKRNAPYSSFLREICCNKMKPFKRKCSSKRYYFWQSKFETLEQSLNDPKLIWENWKKCSETPLKNKESNINGLQWYNHFYELHKDTYQGNIPASIPNTNGIIKVLNDPFTEKEFSASLNNLKITKLLYF